MNLLDLIRGTSKPDSGEVATATLATVATDQASARSTVAEVATVAVAVPRKQGDERPDAAVCSRWTLHFIDGDPLPVTFCPPVALAGALAAYPAAVAAIPVLDPPPAPRGCSTCRHRTRFDNCGLPVEAGLAEVFQLAEHPAGGEGCTVFEPKPIAAEQRVAALLEAGLLDADDAALVRLRYDDDPQQWDELLDAVERSAGRAGR